MEKVYLALFAFHTIGVAIFGRFELESPWWRHIIKWTATFALTYWVATSFGITPALWLIAGLAIAGTVFHIIWCMRNGIHPFKATPRKKYWAIRGWNWSE
jgi:hypothetical protein